MVYRRIELMDVNCHYQWELGDYEVPEQFKDYISTELVK